MSVGKWINQNFYKNYQMKIINSFLLNILEFLDGRPSVGSATRPHAVRGEHLMTIIRSFVDTTKKYTKKDNKILTKILSS